MSPGSAKSVGRWNTWEIATPPDFDFRRTVFSHGWYSLPPFSCDPDKAELRRALELPDGTIATCRLTPGVRTIRVATLGKGSISRDVRSAITTSLRTCLRLDESLIDFHRSLRSNPSCKWIARTRSGRLLRSPTVFEDLLKMICTTNCTWALTTVMVRNIVALLGKQSPEGHHSFPGAEAVAGTTERFLRKRIKAGYRAPYILEFARRVASGQINPEAWRTSVLPTGELLREIQTVRGVGQYAGENLLRLVGRYEHLALDSWVRSKYYDLYHRGRRVSDNTLASRFRRYGKWRGLVFWLEMTRDWHDQKFPGTNE